MVPGWLHWTNLTLRKRQAGANTSELVEKESTTDARCRKTRTCIIVPQTKHNTNQQVNSMDFLLPEVRVPSNFAEINDMGPLEVLQSKRRVAMASRHIPDRAAQAIIDRRTPITIEYPPTRSEAYRREKRTQYQHFSFIEQGQTALA